MKHPVNNRQEMVVAINDAEDGDTIVCYSEDAVALGEQARKRMCPNKKLIFEVTATRIEA